jgi:polyisoprenoid-binding protein YceI
MIPLWSDAMKSELLVGILLFSIAGAPARAAPHAYQMDKDHTIIGFAWNHNRLSTMSGRFMKYDGEFELDFDEPAQSRVSFTIDAASVWTGVDKLDEDMRSKRLFDAAGFREIAFVSTGATKTGLERGQLKGDLTIKGVTRPVTLYIDVNYQGPHIFAASVDKYRDALQAGLTINTRINRSDFGLGMAVPWVGDEIDIRIDTELVAFPPAAD